MFSRCSVAKRVAAAHVYWFTIQDSRFCEDGVDFETCYNREKEECPLEST